MLLQKINVLKKGFPDSWYRKLFYLMFKTYIVKEDGKAVGLLTQKGKEIVLLTVLPEYRGKGYASRLIKQSDAEYVYTYKKNLAAIKTYEKNGFKKTKEKKSILGTKVKLERSTK